MPRGRRTLPQGTFRSIRTYYWRDGAWHRLPGETTRNLPPGARPAKWKAVTQYRPRGGNGYTTQREKQGRTRAKAVAALEEELAAEGGRRVTAPGKARLAGTSRLTDAAAVYLAQLDCDEATVRRRTGDVHNFIVPRVGGLLLEECTPARLNEFMATLTAPTPDRPKGYAPNYRRGIKAALSGIMQVAVDEDVLPHNPCKSMRRIKGGTLRQPMAWDADQVATFLRLVDADAARPARQYRVNLPAVIRVLLGTGMRLGEVLALRWCDVNLADAPAAAAVTLRDGTYVETRIPPRSVWVNGNAVRRTGEGVVRNPGKTPAARRMVGLSQDLALLLATERAAHTEPHHPVFPKNVDLLYEPSEVGRLIRNLRRRITGYDHLISHLCRKTVVTALHNAGQSDRQIADQMGWTNASVMQSYLGVGLPNPQAADVLAEFSRPKR